MGTWVSWFPERPSFGALGRSIHKQLEGLSGQGPQEAEGVAG